MDKVFANIGYVTLAIIVFAVMAIMVPALITAKSTIAVVAGIVIVVLFFLTTISIAINQFKKYLKKEN